LTALSPDEPHAPRPPFPPKFCQAGEDAATIRPVAIDAVIDAFAQRPQHDSTLAKLADGRHNF
jgi:hypothetical protein